MLCFRITETPVARVKRKYQLKSQAGAAQFPRARAQLLTLQLSGCSESCLIATTQTIKALLCLMRTAVSATCFSWQTPRLQNLIIQRCGNLVTSGSANTPDLKEFDLKRTESP